MLSYLKLFKKEYNPYPGFVFNDIGAILALCILFRQPNYNLDKVLSDRFFIVCFTGISLSSSSRIILLIELIVSRNLKE